MPINYDCEEPTVNNIEYISKYKVKEAYNIVQNPCFVVDSSFYIDNYPGEPGFPGAFPKRAIINNQGLKEGINDLLKVMQEVQNRQCQFVDCLTYYDGVEYKTFYGISRGNLAYEKRGFKQEKIKSDLWYVFILDNCIKTLEKMTGKNYSP